MRVSPCAMPVASTSSCTGWTGPWPWGRTGYRRENGNPRANRKARKTSKQKVKKALLAKPNDSACCVINWKILFVHNWTWLKLFWGPSHWDKSKYLKHFLVFLAFIAATVFCFSSGQKVSVGLWLQVLRCGPWQAARPGGGTWRH